jgi:hypothetical protein
MILELDDAALHLTLQARHKAALVNVAHMMVNNAARFGRLNHNGQPIPGTRWAGSGREGLRWVARHPHHEPFDARLLR